MRSVTLFLLSIFILSFFIASFFVPYKNLADVRVSVTFASDKKSTAVLGRNTFPTPTMNPKLAAFKKPKVPTPTNFTTPVPTKKLTVPTPTKKVVSTPTPTIILVKSVDPTPTKVQSTTSLSVQEYIMNEINKYRETQGKSRVTTDSYSCDFAKLRAEEVSKNFDHAGFNSRAASHTLPYPPYEYVNENIAMTSDYKRVVDLWRNSPGHAENMRADTPIVCVEAYGDYYAYEGYRAK